MPKFSAVAAAAAVALFRDQKITVQEATPIKVKGDDGKIRDAFETKMVSLKPAHVLAAKQYEDGTVTVVTLDGQRYSVKSSKALPPADADGDAGNGDGSDKGGN